MRIGIHLPQFGRAITVGGVQRAARTAEEQGFDDLWVSDHLVIPKEQQYPAPYILDPLTTLAFAAAVTEHIGLGTSVLVGPQYASQANCQHPGESRCDERWSRHPWDRHRLVEA